MILGITIEPGHDCTCSTEEEVHLSLASIESRSYCGGAGSYSQLMLKTTSSEQLLCTFIHGVIFQQCLDLKLMPGEKVTFTVQGSYRIYITGYSSGSRGNPLMQTSEQEDTEGRDDDNIAPSPNTSGFQFGAVSSSSQNSQPAVKPFTWGALCKSMQFSEGSLSASKTALGFDAAGTASNTTEVPSFGGFGTNAVTSNTPGFIFGNTRSQQSAVPAFGQGRSLQNSFDTATNSVAAFNFGSLTSCFGSSNPANPNNSGFQAESKSLQFGFQFGQSRNNNQSGVLQFSGASSNTQPTSTSQTGLNVYNKQPPSFNFGASPSNSQLAFQFGSSQQNSGNPFSPAPSGRKIKTAVHRLGRKT